MTGAELKAWRERHKMSLREASEALGCSKTSLMKWEATGGVPRYVALACTAISMGDRPMGSQ
jgi:transcriptional regulator with XRE-family HTH domain